MQQADVNIKINKAKRKQESIAEMRRNCTSLFQQKKNGYQKNCKLNTYSFSISF